MYQHQKVTQFLRQFVGNDGDRGNDTQPHIGHEGGRDGKAIGEVVKAIANDDHPGACRSAAVRMRVRMGMLMFILACMVVLLVVASRLLYRQNGRFCLAGMIVIVAP